MKIILKKKYNFHVFNWVEFFSELNYNFDCDDSDSDNNSESEKLAKTFSHLFNKDTSDEEGSESDESSKYEDEGLELTPECLAEPSKFFIEILQKSFRFLNCLQKNWIII